MKSKKIIILTGSIATGKSTVSNIIKEQGFELIDADKIAHELMEIDKINYNAIVRKFGNNILDKDKNINRKKLSKIVFNDKEKLELLNSLTHKNIFNKIKEKIEKSDNQIIFVDIPLFIDLIVSNPKEKYLVYDEIWVVNTNIENQIKRLMKRDNSNREDVMKRINSQTSIEEKKKYANIIIDNNGSIEDLRREVLKRLESL